MNDINLFIQLLQKKEYFLTGQILKFPSRHILNYIKILMIHERYFKKGAGSTLHHSARSVSMNAKCS